MGGTCQRRCVMDEVSSHVLLGCTGLFNVSGLIRFWGGDGASTIILPKPEGLIASHTNVETLKLVDLLLSHSMQVDNGYDSAYDLLHIPTLH